MLLVLTKLVIFLGSHFLFFIFLSKYVALLLLLVSIAVLEQLFVFLFLIAVMISSLSTSYFQILLFGTLGLYQ